MLVSVMVDKIVFETLNAFKFKVLILLYLNVFMQSKGLYKSKYICSLKSCFLIRLYVSIRKYLSGLMINFD